MEGNRTVNAIILYKGASDFVERMNVTFFLSFFFVYNVATSPQPHVFQNLHRLYVSAALVFKNGSKQLRVKKKTKQKVKKKKK